MKNSPDLEKVLVAALRREIDLRAKVYALQSLMADQMGLEDSELAAKLEPTERQMVERILIQIEDRSPELAALLSSYE
jgi:hypothetical protein